VAGAGRGPLVARSLSAISRSGRDAHVYAVEKNPNAHITYGYKVIVCNTSDWKCRLQGRKEAEWDSKVTLLFGDMRFIDVPEKADILISELLGSFGDNELSPECLDGAMRFLKRKCICTVKLWLSHFRPS
jgi:protein arginine N-methyltransferase 5